MRLRRFQSLFPVVIVLTLLAVPLAASAQEEQTYVVQRGDTLYHISQRFGVSISVIAQANNISNQARIFAGQKLVIPDLSNAVETNLFAGEPTEHVVQPGETLASIANQYGLTVAQLSQLNNITNPNRILRGQTLIVFTTPEPPPDETTAPDTNIVVEPEPVDTVTGTPYVVQPGEHLAEIAQRYGVSWPAIAKANNIKDPNWIEAGETIIIPTDSNLSDFGIITPLVQAPTPTITSGKEIIVDLSDSRIYAYDNGTLVRNVLASTGLPGSPTVKGNFKIQRKYASQTMAGPGYYLPNVQWIMYFYQGYAVHGTYWHNNFGHPMSHGCVNLPNDEALWFYQWAPVGTPVLVQA